MNPNSGRTSPLACITFLIRINSNKHTKFPNVLPTQFRLQNTIPSFILDDILFYSWKKGGFSYFDVENLCCTLMLVVIWA